LCFTIDFANFSHRAGRAGVEHSSRPARSVLKLPDAVLSLLTQALLMYEAFRHDVRRMYETTSGPRWRRITEVARSASMHGVAVFRFRTWLRQQPFPVKLLLAPLSMFLDYRMRMAWGIEIHRGARIGKGLLIVHNGGIFVSSQSVIGENFTMAHDVTIGTGGGQGPRSGAPMIGDNVTVNAGAKVYGKIRVGNNVRIGPNTIVNKDIPDNALVHLPPMQVVTFGRFYNAGERSGAGATPNPPA
jgi:serine O-acetyltransferase